MKNVVVLSAVAFKPCAHTYHLTGRDPSAVSANWLWFLAPDEWAIGASFWRARLRSSAR